MQNKAEDGSRRDVQVEVGKREGDWGWSWRRGVRVIG